MRLEGKNAHIKQLVGKNFKNLPKSVAHRHQRYMCLQLLTPPGVKSTNFLYSGDEIKRGMYRLIIVQCTCTCAISYSLLSSYAEFLSYCCHILCSGTKTNMQFQSRWSTGCSREDLP